jgi:hypothetical protein
LSWEELGKAQVKIDPSQNVVQLTGSTLEEPALQIAKIKYPSGGQEGATITASLPVNVFAKDADTGREYGIISTTLFFSDNDWLTYTPFWTVPDSGTMSWNYDLGLRLPSGRFLTTATVSGGKRVYLSDTAANDEDKTFTKVLDLQVGSPNNKWGFAVHGNLIFLSEYGNNARHAYMSVDGGLAWTQIFEGPADAQFHIHDIGYDPYHSAVYIVTGDGAYKTFYYSLDYGATWKSITPSSHQYVGVAATPQYIILGTDRAPNGIHVLRKRFVNGRLTISADDITVRYAYDDTKTLSALFHTITYINGAWYAVNSSTTPDIYPVIVASPDGWNWYEIYRHPVKVTTDYRGFVKLFTDGTKLYANYADDTSTKNKFEITLPTWAEL